jgi:hypothetical protein
MEFTIQPLNDNIYNLTEVSFHKDTIHNILFIISVLLLYFLFFNGYKRFKQLTRK